MEQLAIGFKKEFGWKFINDCKGKHTGFSHNSELAIIDERILLNQSNLVLFSSHLLTNKFGKQRINPFLIQNSTEYELFHQAHQIINPQMHINYNHPIIGYYGAIADWFDTRLVADFASSHPEWTFLLIGSTELADLKSLHGRTNVQLLGEQPYDILQEYLSVVDVCPIPISKILSLKQPIQ